MALGGHAHVHDGPAGNSMLSPHANRELFGRVMTGLVRERRYLAAGTELAAALAGGPPGYTAVRGELGTVLGESLRLFAAIDATVAGATAVRGARAGRVGLAVLATPRVLELPTVRRRRIFGQLALQRPAVDAQPAGRLRDVAARSRRARG